MNLFRSVLLVLPGLLAFNASAQTPPKKARFYISIVSTIFEGSKYKGPLLEVRDTSVTVLSKGEPLSIPYNSIKHIKFKRTAAVGRGAAVGGAVGLLTGVILGFATGGSECPPGQICLYESTAGENALAGGLVCSALGTTIGVVVGAASGRKIKIYGDIKVFQSRSEDLKKYSLSR
jgi:hypothetical protein